MITMRQRTRIDELEDKVNLKDLTWLNVFYLFVCVCLHVFVCVKVGSVCLSAYSLVVQMGRVGISLGQGLTVSVEKSCAEKNVINKWQCPFK